MPIAAARLGIAAAAGLLFGTLTTIDSASVAVADRRVTLAPTGPVIDQPAPYLWDSQRHQRVGGKVGRFELDNPTKALDLSGWYHVAAVIGSDRLQAYDHNPPTSLGPSSTIARAQDVAWHVATNILDRTTGPARPGDTPAWARPRTGNANGSSGGLLYALASLDILTPGPLAGHLRVVATGQIFSDGTVTAVRHVDAKLAAARLIHPDVVFTPAFPQDTDHVTLVESSPGIPDSARPIGEWLNTAGYEHAGRIAGKAPGGTTLVAVHDVRQALAWLCGRTQRPATCTLAHQAAAEPYGAVRAINPPATPAELTTGHPAPR